ncbi:MAG: hypothetical protein Q8P39_02685, partial [Candidatus Yanofskybacteria bacterium]|nr:hypothetical protein [Candidatus Yanofskybacteria bacterium]
MKFSYSLLKEYVPDIPKPDHVALDIAMHAFEVEEVKKKAKDWIFDIAVLPPRADCLSHYGMA